MTVLEKAKQDIQSRMSELAESPVFVEYHQLETALQALTSTDEVRANKAPQASSSPQAASRGRGRRTGGRADQTVQYFRENPGASVSDVAAALGMHTNYAHTVVRKLRSNEVLRKDGTGHFVNEARSGNLVAAA